MTKLLFSWSKIYLFKKKRWVKIKGSPSQEEATIVFVSVLEKSQWIGSLLPPGPGLSTAFLIRDVTNMSHPLKMHHLSIEAAGLQTLT